MPANGAVTEPSRAGESSYAGKLRRAKEQSRATERAAAVTPPQTRTPPGRARQREDLLPGGCARWAWSDEIWCMEEDESAPRGVGSRRLAARR